LLHQNNKTLGYIEISSFSFDTAKEFKKHLSILESKKIDGLIIDLRDNPGGSLETVEEIASLFVTSDKTIVQMVDKSGKKEVFHSKLKQKKPYKIDLLINGQSASASEILSAAMNEAEGYPLVGEKSFGKGIAQSLLDLKDGSQIKLTTQKWLTPNGNWIHKKGIKPTFEVKQPSYFTTSPILIKKPLKFDVVDTQVKNAQILLKVIGYDSHRNDGYFSSDTKVAVENFQKSTNLKVTGILDSVTADLINQKVREKIEDTNNDFQLKEAIEILTK
jgi:carboxyl-terminal processing protease